MPVDSNKGVQLNAVQPYTTKVRPSDVIGFDGAFSVQGATAVSLGATWPTGATMSVPSLLYAKSGTSAAHAGSVNLLVGDIPPVAGAGALALALELSIMPPAGATLPSTNPVFAVTLTMPGVVAVQGTLTIPVTGFVNGRPQRCTVVWDPSASPSLYRDVTSLGTATVKCPIVPVNTASTDIFNLKLSMAATVLTMDMPVVGLRFLWVAV